MHAIRRFTEDIEIHFAQNDSQDDREHLKRRYIIVYWDGLWVRLQLTIRPFVRILLYRTNHLHKICDNVALFQPCILLQIVFLSG